MCCGLIIWFLFQNTAYQPAYQQNHHIKSESDHQENGHQDIQETANKTSNLYNPRPEDGDILKDFTVSKSDPKYQTLPYNTKFTVNLLPSRTNNLRVTENNNNNVNSTETTKEIEVNHHHISSSWAHVNGNVQSPHMTVHSAPLSAINKNIATPLSQNDALSRKLSNEQGTESNSNGLNGNTVDSRGNLYQNSIKGYGNEHPHYPVNGGITNNTASHQVCNGKVYFQL